MCRNSNKIGKNMFESVVYAIMEELMIAELLNDDFTCIAPGLIHLRGRGERNCAKRPPVSCYFFSSVASLAFAPSTSLGSLLSLTVFSYCFLQLGVQDGPDDCYFPSRMRRKDRSISSFARGDCFSFHSKAAPANGIETSSMMSQLISLSASW
jgi:hypothetical protein